MSDSTEKTVKVKKDKSSKKRKSEDTTELATKIPKSSKRKSETSPQTATEVTKAAQSPEPTVQVDIPSEEAGSPEPPTKKRKVSLGPEIEVDITAPEPPSKKALRRLKKGKPLPPSKSGANSSPEPETDGEKADSKKKKPEVEKRSEHGVWVGNLPWSVQKSDLRTFFTENSDITDEGITRIHMPSPDDGKPANKVEEVKSWKKQYNKGFAYVDFSTAEFANEAVELSEQLLQGRAVLIKNNKSFEGRPLKTKEETRAEGKEPSKRVFVGNLRFDTTKESLQEHFERCGPIETLMIATFEDSGKCKGYGWITFEELAAAEAAVKGWVKIEEKEETGFSDSESSSGDSSDDDEEKEIKAKPAPKKAPIKKWFVDKIHGRPVRREFAEAPQVRYKKRYGKDGTKAKLDGIASGAGAGAGDGEGVEERRAPPRPIMPTKKVEYRQPYAPRLTGGIIPSEGKKVVF
jgi:RNA recognition motif-containing protein